MIFLASLVVFAAFAGFFAGIVANHAVPDLGARAAMASQAVISKVAGVRGAARNSTIHARAARSVAMASEVTRNAFTVAKNLIGFAWHWRNWIMAGLVFLLLWSVVRPIVSFVSCPFGGALWCATSRAEAIEQRDELRGQLEAWREMTRVTTPIIGSWERARANLGRDLAIGAEQIENAAHVSPGVPREIESVSRAVLIAWARADQRLCDGAGGCGDTRA